MQYTNIQFTMITTDNNNNNNNMFSLIKHQYLRNISQSMV